MSIPAKLVMLLLIFMAGVAAGIKYQTGELAKLRKEQSTLALDATREARAIESRRAQNVQEAQHAQTQRTQAAQAAAAAARTELDRLRGQLAQSPGPGTEPPAACAVRAAAVSDLLGQCAGAYQELARKADGHANDARTLIDAWPR
jgi:preprotein translocase subunit SecF